MNGNGQRPIDLAIDRAAKKRRRVEAIGQAQIPVARKPIQLGEAGRLTINKSADSPP